MGRYSPEQRFNMQGKTKCSECGLYYPEMWASHGRECSAYVAPEDEDE